RHTRFSRDWSSDVCSSDLFVTAATGMDALTHNMEAYIAKNYHPMCSGIALEGIKLINESIVEATHQPSLESRSKMLIASLMGAEIGRASCRERVWRAGVAG